MGRKQHPPYTTLKRALAGQGITYKDVAEVIGTTEATVQQKINGSYDFYVVEQLAICSAFGFSSSIFFADLVTLSDNKSAIIV